MPGSTKVSFEDITACFTLPVKSLNALTVLFVEPLWELPFHNRSYYFAIHVLTFVSLAKLPC